MKQLNLASIPEMQLKSSYGELDVSGLGNRQKFMQQMPSSSPANTSQPVQMVNTAQQDTTAEGVASGVMQGAQIAGPKGAIIGGIAGGLSARSKRKARERQAMASVEQAKGAIAERSGQSQVNILQGLAANLSNTLV